MNKPLPLLKNPIIFASIATAVVLFIFALEAFTHTDLPGEVWALAGLAIAKLFDLARDVTHFFTSRNGSDSSASSSSATK